MFSAPETRARSRRGRFGFCRVRSLTGTCVSLALLALVLGLVPIDTVQAESAELAEMRARIAANGWSWEADDTFVNSLTSEERANLYGFVPPDNWEEILESRRKVFRAPKDLPSNWDWRSLGGETPVKNQAMCGSCWAFAATAEIEAWVKIYYGIELNLSEQQGISCNPYGAGCSGGWAEAVYQVAYTYGLINEHCMPYDPGNADWIPCTQTDHHPFARITGWHSISNNVTQIKTALLDGPVCTGISAGGSLDLYGGGCYDTPGGWVDHLVLIVGWDDRLCDGNGAWIIKNSWGPGWGMSGWGYIQYDAASIGSGVTQIEYTPPPSAVHLLGPSGSEPLIGDTETEITWYTTGAPVSTVDIYFSVDNDHFETLLVENYPNNGTFTWAIPNEATTNGQLLIIPHTGSEDGFGFSNDPLTIIGHKVRYVSAAGSNTPPYESPGSAAHIIGDAVLACTGYDSVMVAEGDYFETVTVSSTVMLFGGWNASFTVRDPEYRLTRLRATGSALRFFGAGGDFAGVDGFVFHDCIGGSYSEPKSGRHGGGIYSMGVSPTISNCVFENNRAALSVDFGLGGAILAAGGSPRILDCRFENNVATGGGAVALIDAVAASLSGNVFEGNSCSDSTSSDNRGAALYVDGGVASLTGDRFLYNGGSAYGGGIAAEGAVLTASDLIVTGNRAFMEGGGVHADSTEVNISGTVLSDNQSAGSAGGLLASYQAVTLSNLLVTGNASTNLGGGLWLLGATNGSVENCLVADNSAVAAGGGAFLIANGVFTVRNNIVSGNAGDGLFCAGEFLTADYNDVWNNDDDYAGGDPGLHDISADPLFVDAAAGDYGLGLHSQCLDRGDPDPGCQDPDSSPADIGLLGGPDAQTVAPAAVVGAQIQDLGGGDFRISWTANSEPDIDRYVVYRDSATTFVPGVSKAIASVEHPATFWDDTPSFGCYYLVVPVDTEGHVGGYSARVFTEDLTAVAGQDVPSTYRIASVMPNPFNPRTTIWYDAPHDGRLSLRVYDLRGRLVRNLVSGRVVAGRHSVDWDGRDARGMGVAAGMYFVHLKAGRVVATTKVMLAK